MIDIKSIISSNEPLYEYLNENDKLNFIKSIDDLLVNFENKISKTGLYEVDIEILKYMFIYFVSNNNFNEEYENEKIYNKFKLQEIIKEQLDKEFSNINIEKIEKITINDIIIMINIINKEDLWNFLKNNIDLLYKTPYYKYLIEDNKLLDNYYIDNTTLNLKNIYNISKSLSHNSLTKWELLNDNYVSLSNFDKINFFIKLFGNNIDWINLKNNFKRQFIGISYNYKTELNNLITQFQNIFIELVFIELITNGLLNEFVLNKEITDKSYSLTKRKKLIKEMFDKNKNEWLESYYYLTNDKFKNLKKIRFEKNKIINKNNKYDEYHYFDIISMDHEWPLFYAMDWINQISFFQHYLYHRVLYITGSPGQGKSTQVPKLLLYALKMINYNINGKIVVSQPRTKPTEDNAKRIAEELGLPIEVVSNNSDIKMRTNNYFVQFKHKTDNHISEINNYNMKITTDGTLILDLKTSLSMFKKINDQYINENIYDIIVVDEAHEHNINMDLIIALSKQACYINNKIKLVIVSATMDDDEPIYRSYFKIINDKLMYPIKTEFIKHPLIPEINNFKPNPIFMDRRYHISPPGETSRYQVRDFYLENYIENENTYIASINAQEKGYEKVLDICKNTTSGAILFFANGTKEIIDAVKYLNDRLPLLSDIALPFYSDLHPQYQNIITKMKLNNIRNKKENIYKEWKDKYIEDKNIPLGLYNRAIIVATNIAEASITIPNLKYIIDNGYAKYNIYKPEFNKVVLEPEKISESSRLQRRGRVGRKNDGYVYYMYEKGTRKNIKPKYKITQEELSITLLNLLGDKNINDLNIQDNENYNKLIMGYNIDLNIYHENNLINEDYYVYKTNLYNIYQQNYKINGINIIDYYNNSINTDIVSIFDFVLNVFYNGQTIKNILDVTGQFYLIHPFERDIKRNILNQIIIYDNRNTDIIPTYAYRFMLNYLFNKNLLIDYDVNGLYQYVKDFNLKRNFIKTELAQYVSLLYKELGDVNVDEILIYIYSYMFGCYDEVTPIIIFLKIINYDITKITNLKWNVFKQIYQNNYTSDLIFIHDIIKKIKNKFSNLFKNYNFNNNFNNKLINIFKNINTTDPPKTFDMKIWNELQNLKYNKQELNINSNVIYSNLINNEIQNYIKQNDNEIKIWCDNNKLNYNVIIDFITQYFKISQDTQNIQNIIKLNSKSYFDKLLTDYTLEEKIIKSFLFSKLMQFILLNQFSNYYDYKTFINFNYYNVSNTFLNNSITNNLGHLTFYLNFTDKSIDNKQNIDISILSNVKIEWIMQAYPLLVNPLLTPDVILNTGLEDNQNYIIYDNNFNTKIMKKDIINIWNYNLLPWNINETPILQHFYKEIYKYISNNMKY